MQRPAPTTPGQARVARRPRLAVAAGLAAVLVATLLAGAGSGSGRDDLSGLAPTAAVTASSSRAVAAAPRPASAARTLVHLAAPVASPSTTRISATTAKTATAPTLSTGTRSVLVMLVDWTHPDATTPAQAVKQIATTDNAWYREVSSGQVGFTATATPWMTIAKADCTLGTGGYWNVLAAAEAQARARGFDPAAYDHEMVYFPFDSTCAYAGLGGTAQRASWINGEMDSRVTIHELGHNLGLQHSHSLTCVNAAGRQVALSTKCTSDEYGDLFDVMGAPAGGVPKHFSAVQMNQLGWLNGRFVTVTGSTSVTLAPLEAPSSTSNQMSLAALRIAARIKVGTTEYWFDYRQATGVDQTLGAYPGATDGILIHRLNANGTTDLLDGRSDTKKDFANAALPVGATWTTPEGVTVRVGSATATGATVRITFPATGPGAAQPTGTGRQMTL